MTLRSKARTILAFATLLAGCSGEAPQEQFEIRGVKGLWWERGEKYKSILRTLPRNHMNFLMICYTSYPATATSWRAGFSAVDLEEIGEIQQEAHRSGVKLCVAINPAIWGKKPLTYCSDEEMALLLRSYGALADLGVRWFSVCLDDIGHNLNDEDAKKYANLAEAQTDFVNRLWKGLREKAADSRLIFCPSAYTTETMLGNREYIDHLAKNVDPGVDFFWTGPVVWSPSISDKDAELAARLCGRKVVIWDNYPANDNYNWRPLLSPYRNRGAGLPKRTKGYVANLMFQEQASRIPVITLGEYFRDPKNYDPDAALQKALKEVGRGAADKELRVLARHYGKYFYDDPKFADPVAAADDKEAASIAAELEKALAGLRNAKGFEQLYRDVAPTVEADLVYLKRKAAGPAKINTTVSIKGTDFAGGGAPHVGSEFFDRKGVNTLYANSTVAFMMEAHFDIDYAPAGKCFLEVFGRDDDAPGHCEISIEVNHQDVHRGGSGFPGDKWGARSFEIPNGALKKGKNIITVWTLAGRGEMGKPPWFMISEARVVLR